MKGHIKKYIFWYLYFGMLLLVLGGFLVLEYVYGIELKGWDSWGDSIREG